MMTRGMQSVEAEKVFNRAAEISERRGDFTALYKAKWNLWLNANIRRETALARDRARELLTLAQRSDDGELLLEAYHCRWSTAFFRGEVAADIWATLVGVETYDFANRTVISATLSAAMTPAFAPLWPCGRAAIVGRRELGKGRVRDKGVALAETLDQPNSLAHALHNSAMCYQLVADRERPSRPRNASRRWRRNLGCCHIARAACY